MPFISSFLVRGAIENKEEKRKRGERKKGKEKKLGSEDKKLGLSRTYLHLLELRRVPS